MDYIKHSFLLVQLLLILSQTGYSQNFTWLTGSTGTSTGNAMTTDTLDSAYVVGAYNPNSSAIDQFGNPIIARIGFPPVSNFTGSMTSAAGADRQIGYVTKYHTDDGTPTHVAFIQAVQNAGSCSVSGPFYCIPRRTIIDPFGRVHVLGVFRGCDLNFLEVNPTTGALSSGMSTTISGNVAASQQMVFLATFDRSLTAIACQVFYTLSGDSAFSGDVTVGMHPTNQPKIYLSGSFSGSNVFCESFGSATTASAPFNAFPISLANGYEIYLGQLDMASLQLENIQILGGPEHDFCSDLAAGYHSYDVGTDLYMSGTFKGPITFNDPQTGTNTVLSQGDFDLFACRFPGFDISMQDAVTAGGPSREYALALSDDGGIVGGAVCDNAIFPGQPPVSGLGLVMPNAFNYPTFQSLKEGGFLAYPDYDTGLWSWLQILADPDRQSQVNAIAKSTCNEFYVAWNRGMHPGNGLYGGLGEGLGLPYANYDATHIYATAALNGYDHFYYSTLSKWVRNGNSGTQEWQYDFVPPGVITGPPYPVFPIPGTDTNIRAVYITDLEVLDAPIHDYDTTDVLFVGRFGDSVHTAIDTFFGDLVNPNQHLMSSMFFGGLDEHPNFNSDTISVCILEDTFHLNSWSVVPSGNSYNFTPVGYGGTGVIDSINGVFDPQVAGIGEHVISLKYEYYGCLVYSEYLVINVVEFPFPQHPITTGASWAEGLAVDGALHTELTTTDSVFNHNLYFLSGRYSGSISFDKANGPAITLTAPSATSENGFIAAFDGCGVIWANNVVGLGDDYIEALSYDLKYVSSEVQLPALNACGTVQDTLYLENSTGNPSPNSSINNIPFGSITSGTEKGIVMELSATTGKINWVFLAGEGYSETNRIHDLSVEDGYIGVIGEFSGNYSLPIGTLSSLGGTYDPMLLLLNTSGGLVDHGFTTLGFGGTSSDDHGDAIDMFELNGDIEIITTGYLDDGSGVHPFVNPSSSTFSIPTTDEENIFLAHYRYTNSGNLIHNKLKIYGGRGSDFALDVKFGDLADNLAFGNNQVFFCGNFEDSLEISVPTSSSAFTTTGPTDFDGFAGCTDLLLNDRWFAQEGRGLVGTNDAISAISVSTDELALIGNQDGINNVSNFNNGSGSWTTNWLLGSGHLSRHDIFSSRIDPSGSMIDTSFTLPGATGYCTGSDISYLDTALLNSGYFSISFAQVLSFFKNPGLGIHRNLEQNSNLSDAFISRQRIIGLGNFKTFDRPLPLVLDEQVLVQIFPNPSKGVYHITLPHKIDGRLRVSDYAGRIVLEKPIRETSKIEFQLKSASGLYLYELFDGSRTHRGKITLQK